jgi:hypothetical protein
MATGSMLLKDSTMCFMEEYKPHLMDEIANWVVVTKTETSGMTVEMNTKFHKAIMIENEKPVTIRAKLTEKDEKKLQFMHKFLILRAIYVQKAMWCIFCSHRK